MSIRNSLRQFSRLSIACWSPKGGVGTSVTTAVLALSLAKRVDTVLIDASGDQAAIFGLTPSEIGFSEWTLGGETVPAAALSRLARPIRKGLRLIDSGREAVDPPSLTRVHEAFPDAVVIFDLGCLPSSTGLKEIIESSHSLMVLRPCYLGAHRARASTNRSDGLILVDEPGRVLRAKDLSEVLETKIVATVSLDPGLARLVDAGRIGQRLPRSTRSLDRLASSLIEGDLNRAR